MVRFKNRYLLIEAYPVDDGHNLVDYSPTTHPSLTCHHLAAHLRATLSTNFGLLLAALTTQSLSLKYCNAATGMAIVRSPRDLVGCVAASVCMMGAPEGVKGRWIWSVVRVSGTIRGAQRAAMGHATMKLERAFKQGLLRNKDGAGSIDAGRFKEMLRKCREAIKAIDP